MSCPLGFGTSSGGKPELTPYHCVLCRGLLHNPRVTDGCRHTFCEFCIRRFRDCPVCGADIAGTTVDSSLSEAISKLLLGHAKLVAKTSTTAAPPTSPCPVGRAAGAPNVAAGGCPMATAGPVPSLSVPGVGPVSSLDLSSLLLQLALQSLAGGNPEAALARLDMCAEALCGAAESHLPSPSTSQKPASKPQQPSCCARTSPDAGTTQHRPAQVPSSASQGATDAYPDRGATTSTPFSSSTVPTSLDRCLRAAGADPDTASRLGAVLGCKADCHRRLGDPAAAHQHYQASLSCLTPWRGGSREADSALSVTHNKLGDLMLLGGRLAEARRAYERALDIRRSAVAAAGPRTAPEAAEDATAVAAAEAGASAAPAGAGPAAEERVQDVCDLATSLCKVADVCLLALQEEGEQQQQRQAGRSEMERERPGAEAAREGGAEAHAARGPDGTAMSGPNAEQLARPAELLAEARTWLLSDDMLPYARACGLKTAALGSAAAAEGPESARSEAGAAGEVGQVPGPGHAGDEAEGGDRAAQGEQGDGREGAAGGRGHEERSGQLPPQLVQRYGRVWCALEQLAARLADMQQQGVTPEASGVAA